MTRGGHLEKKRFYPIFRNPSDVCGFAFLFFTFENAVSPVLVGSLVNRGKNGGKAVNG